MIELTTNTAAMLYLLITLTVLLGIWASHHFRSRKNKIVIIEQELRICEYCHYAYLYSRAKPITQCPQCQCYNKH